MRPLVTSSMIASILPKILARCIDDLVALQACGVHDFGAGTAVVSRSDGMICAPERDWVVDPYGVVWVVMKNSCRMVH